MKKFLTILLSCVMLLFIVTSCNSNNQFKTPQEALENVYGNQEYKISFMSEGLSVPLDSMNYTANNMPKLPVPEKIGYIFSGWYLDEKLTIPYTDGILYLYMKDVTLYPKWEKESFLANGKYDIEYEANIIEDSVVKGLKTDDYGGYIDFTECLVKDEIYLEKSDDKFLLKLQYDTKVTIPMFTNAGDVFTVKISSLMDSSIVISDRINSLADPKKTVFIDLTNFSLEDTLYLDIQTTNWFTDGLSDSSRLETVTRYTVAINFTKIIGFSSSYVDTSVPLEKGYYLVKSYYAKQDNSATMADSFNPVYSYLYSDGNENYKLIKQNIAYAGLTSSSGITLENTKDNYYNRLMSFIPIQLFYEITNVPETKDVVTSDYYPLTYGAKYYGDYAMEYHADSGKFYNIYDLGSNLDSSYMTMNAVTGFMEVASGMGYNNLILRIDYKHMTKLAEVDYEPLSGDSFQYETNIEYYPGSTNDLVKRDMNYDLMKENGLVTEMVNFYFTAPFLGLSTNDYKQCSSRICVTPTKGTNSQTISDSRYRMAYFTVNHQIYGYDYKSEDKLYADVMGVTSMSDDGMRYNREIKNGKSCEVGDVIRLSDIYNTKCDSKTDFSSVLWTVYNMKDGKVLFDDKVNLKNSTFIFEKDVAVLFENKTRDGTKYSLVELALYEEPKVTIKNNDKYPYDPQATYVVGDKVSFPYVTYSWMGNVANMIDSFFEDPTSTSDSSSINLLRSAIYKEVDGVYVWYDGVGYNETTFVVPSEKFIVVYEFTNIYGEIYHYSIPFVSNSQSRYSIVDNNDNLIDEGTIKYNSEGKRTSISVSLESKRINKENYNDILFSSYKLNISGFTRDFKLSEYSIVTDTKEEDVLVIDDSDICNILWDKIKTQKYAAIKLVYKIGDDTISATYYYNMNFSGKMTCELMDYNDYFTNQEYSFVVPSLYDLEGNFLTNGSASCPYRYVKLDKDKYQYKLLFTQSGSYDITQNYYIGSINLHFTQTIYVWNDNVDISITYITDLRRPFNDGSLERTVKYNLKEAIYSLKKTGFDECVPVGDILYGWSLKEGSYDCEVRSGNVIENFISKYNSKSLILYAIWDSGLELTVNRGDGITYTKKYYLDSFIRYSISSSDFDVITLDGYKNTGWICDIWNGRMITSINVSPSRIDWENATFIVNPVFKKEFTVKYEVNSNYSNSFFRNEIVLDGNYISSVFNKVNVNCKVSGYKFVGWYIKGDETQTVIDLEMYPITKDIIFVAKFVPDMEV